MLTAGGALRTVSQDEHAEAPRDAGIVGDIIAQLADPLAFYRELVRSMPNRRRSRSSSFTTRA